jgi:heme oxygenase
MVDLNKQKNSRTIVCVYAQSRISEFAKSHDLKRRHHAMLWLSKVYGIPAGMYASQVWGTVYLSEGSEFGSQLQKRHLCSLRRILGV